MKHPLISIITPTFNPTVLIHQTYDALAIQKFKDFEWVLVDDASSNNDILETLSSKTTIQTRVIYNQENQGASHCRNEGAFRAKGEYLLFLDDDDLISGNLLASMVEKLQEYRKNGSDAVVFCESRKFVEEDGEIKFFKGRSSMRKDFFGLDGLQFFLNSAFLHHSALLIPSKYFQTIGGYDERLKVDEDGNLIIKLMLQNYLFLHEPRAYHLYRQHNVRDRLSYNETADRIENRLLAMKILIKLFSKQDLLPLYSLALAKRLDHIALAACSRNYKKLATEILSLADNISPGYLQNAQGIKGHLRRWLGCANYDRLLRLYSLIRQEWRVNRV